MLWAVEGNQACVECGKKDPDWLSINLAVMFCVECSGHHRRLGTHITKVRSATLDKLDPFLMKYLVSIGNTRSSSVWEASLSGAARPHSTDQAAREMWMKAKYELRAFLPRVTPKPTPEQLKDLLVLAVARDDLIGAMEAWARGAVLDTRIPPDDRPLLQDAILRKSPLMVEFLIQNGASLSLTGPNNWNMLHVSAGIAGSVEITEQLLARGAKTLVAEVDAHGRTPLDLARTSGFVACATVLEEAKKSLEEAIRANIINQSVLELQRAGQSKTDASQQLSTLLAKQKSSGLNKLKDML